jgi:hypothetical protein
LSNGLVFLCSVASLSSMEDNAATSPGMTTFHHGSLTTD